MPTGNYAYNNMRLLNYRKHKLPCFLPGLDQVHMFRVAVICIFYLKYEIMAQQNATESLLVFLISLT